MKIILTIQKHLCILLSVAFATACTNFSEPVQVAKNDYAIPTDTVTFSATDTAFSQLNGCQNYKGMPLSGVLVSTDPATGLTEISSYLKGWQEGKTLRNYTATGKAESLRWYRHGEKDSTHIGWWPNGNKRFEYRFDSGQYNGTAKEWYETGELFKAIEYKNGLELSGQGWRPNGKLFLNYAVRNGRYYGRANGKMCYELVKENGVYNRKKPG